MSNELLKKLGLGLLVLMVVCNTVRIQGMKKDSRKSREAFTGMRARIGEAMKMQRPEISKRGDRRGGQRPERGLDSKRGKQQKQESK